MDKQVVTLNENASILQACKMLTHHKYLALPVVDREGRICGIVDIALLNDDSYDLRQESRRMHYSKHWAFTPIKLALLPHFGLFVFVYPAHCNHKGGTLCAVLASFYELTLAKSLVLAFFLTLVLGLGESKRSMSVTIQALRSVTPTLQWYLQTLRHEFTTAVLLGMVCGSLVGLIVWIWRASTRPNGYWRKYSLIALRILIGIKCPSIAART